MIPLPNDCACSEPTVNPKNWKVCKASALSKKWYIQYYFYDNSLNQKKFIIVKGMNQFKTLEERREATKRLLENELYQLKEKGYNPITKKFLSAKNVEIDPETRFIDALKMALDLLKVAVTTKREIKVLIKHSEQVIKRLGIDRVEIQNVRRKHIVELLENMKSVKKSWSAYSYNNCRAYLMMLFKKLVLMEGIEINPVVGIPKMPIPVKLRRVLNYNEREEG